MDKEQEKIQQSSNKRNMPQKKSQKEQQNEKKMKPLERPNFLKVPNDIQSLQKQKSTQSEKIQGQQQKEKSKAQKENSINNSQYNSIYSENQSYIHNYSSEKKKNSRQSNQRKSSSKISNKRKVEQKKFSQFDKLEEVRFKSFETAQTISKLVSLIEQQSLQNEEDCFSANFLFTLPPESWQEIRSLANEAQNLYSSSQNEWELTLESFANEIQLYKQRCSYLKEKIELIKSESYTHDKDQQKEYEHSLKIIANAYNKNRTQVFNVMDEMELAIHDIKNGLQKRKVKKLGYMTQLDKDIDELFSDFISKSGRINICGLSYRGPGNESQRNKIYNYNQDNEKNTPRSIQPQISGIRGRSQHAQDSSRGDIASQRSNDIKNSKVNIPLLPIHMIGKKENPQLSNRGMNSQRNQQIHQQPQQSSRQQLSARGYQQQLSNRGNNVQKSSRVLDSKRSYVAGENQGGIIDGEYLVNPVFLGAAAYQTSQFDKNLENDFEGADQTLPYPEAYEDLMLLQDEEERILAKQILFFVHEKTLKAQAKQEKLLKQKLRRAQNSKNQQQLDGTTPRGQNNRLRGNGNNENEDTLKEPSVENGQGRFKRKHSSNSSQDRNQQIYNDNSQLSQSLAASHISLQKQLPLLGTLELISARRKEDLKDVDLSQILEVSIEIAGLIKTVTEKSIIQKIEQEYKMKEDLLKEERKVLDWSSGDEEKEKNQKKEEKEKNNKETKPNRKLFSNGAISIIDMQNAQENNGQNKGSIEIVGELNQENDEYSSSALSMNSSEILDQYKQQNQKQLESHQQNLSPITDDLLLSPDKDSTIEQQNNKYLKDKQNLKLQLEIIQERQSEFSSSFNTNRFMSKMNSNRSKSKNKSRVEQQRLENVIYTENKMPQYKIQSARETPCSKNNVDFNKLLYLPQNDQKTQRNQRNDSEYSQLKYKRCKSHRQSAESAPNSQRSKVHKKQNNNELIYHHNNKNFHSIQVDESFEENYFNNIKQNLKQCKNSYENSYSRLMSMDAEQSNNSLQEKKSQGKNNLNKFQEQHQQKQSPNQEIQVSIQNQFEESKASSFKNESFELEGSIKFQKREALSDYDFREQDDMCDMDDIDLNQVQIYNRMIPLSYLREIQANNINLAYNNRGKQQFIGPHDSQKQILMNNSNANLFSKYQLITNPINSSLLLANQSNQSSFHHNLQNSRPFSNNHQMTANMLNNFLQNQTYNKLPAGQSTRDVPTCKKDQRAQVQGGFTLSTFGDDTLFYMFPAQKTQRRTLFMMQNLNNNYYNNCAGVLFTMPISGDLNNGFLQQCSTVPSDPELISGGITIQDAGSNQINTKKMRNLNQNTQDSLIRDDNILHGLQRYCIPQFSLDNKKLNLSKNANSTEDSAFKSTNLPTRFLFQQHYQNKQDSTLSPKMSYDNTDQKITNLSSDNKERQSSDGKTSVMPNFFHRSKNRNQQQNSNQQHIFAKEAVNLQSVIDNSGIILSGMKNISSSNSFIISPSTTRIQSSSEKPKQIFNRNMKIVYNSLQGTKQGTNQNNSVVIKKQHFIKFQKNDQTNTSFQLQRQNINTPKILQSEQLKRRQDSFPIKF